MFRKTPFCALAVLTLSASSLGQAQFGWEPSAELIEIPTLDFEALAAEDITREENGMAPRYAVPHKVTEGPAYGGTWSKPDADTWLWELRVASPDCLSINLAFEHFIMPENAVMTISSHDDRFSLRPLTMADNNPDNEYWTPPVPDSEIKISIEMDAKVRPMVENGIVLTSINVGYRGFYDGAFDVEERSGSCNYDVECDETEGWENEIPCVAVISTGGSTFCTGFMVNNQRNDREPLFMTANHCGITSGNAASLVTFWNYQDPEDGPLDCPGNSIDGGPQDQYLSGSQFLASYSPSDFTIVKLNQSPPQEWEISYCGWSAEDVVSEYSVAIHHPSTDYKRWSIDYEPSQIYGYNAPGDTHLRIVDWDLGTTEPGSSGSPLFDQNHRVVGQLHGGYAACGNDLEDWYGRIAVSWNNGLQPHLDPDNTGILVCNTLPGVGLSVTPAAATQHVATAGGADVDPLSVAYTLTNNSPDPIDWNATVTATDGNGEFILLSKDFGAVSPGGTDSFDATVDTSLISTWENGVYTCTVEIVDESNDVIISREHILDLGTTLIEVTPEDDLVGGGPVGGPFTTTQTYTVTSKRPTETQVKVSAENEDWVTVTPSEFTLNGVNDSRDVVVGFSTAANDLPAGIYEQDINFINETDPDTPFIIRGVTLDVGRYTYISTDTPLSIEDNSQFTSTIQVPDSYCVADVDVIMDITHTYIGDLEVVLTSPSGTSVFLHNRSGGGSDDIFTTYDDDGGGTLPDGPGQLEDYYTEASPGTWSLLVSDNAGADVGTLNGWSLKIASTGETCPPSCQDVTAATDSDTPVEIQLVGSSVEGNPLDYIITSLPNDGTLSDPDGGSITPPYTLANGGSRVIYTPDAGYIGSNMFTYRVNDGSPSEEAMVTIDVGQLPNPDNCSDAFLVGNGSYDFDTTAATTDGPSHGECQFDGQTYYDIWYEYVACDDGDMVVSTCSTADYDTDLVVYSNTDCGNLQLLGCNDDGDGCDNYTSFLTVPVTRDQSYLIRVGGWDDESFGTGTLLIDGPETGCDEEPECPTDLDGDGTTGVNDVLQLIGSWGTPDGDVNGDGTTDVSDILLILDAFGEDC